MREAIERWVCSLDRRSLRRLAWTGYALLWVMHYGSMMAVVVFLTALGQALGMSVWTVLPAAVATGLMWPPMTVERPDL